jgi:hypothetical protein
MSGFYASVKSTVSGEAGTAPGCRNTPSWACSPPRVEAFYAAIERLVIARLTRLGLDGARAWRDRYHAEAPPER